MMGQVFDITSGKEITGRFDENGQDSETQRLNEIEIAGFKEMQKEENRRCLIWAENEKLRPDMRNVELVRVALRSTLKEVISASQDKYAKRGYVVSFGSVEAMKDELLIHRIVRSTSEDWAKTPTYYRALLTVALKRCGVDIQELG